MGFKKKLYFWDDPLSTNDSHSLLPRHIPGVYLGSGILVKDQTVVPKTPGMAWQQALSTKKKVEETCHQNKNPGAHLEQTNPLLTIL